MLKPLIVSVFFIIVCFSCQDDLDPKSEQQLKLFVSSSYQTDIPEASGLCTVSPIGHYFAISDRPNNTIYRIDSLGNILNYYNVDASDIEGITVNPIDSTIWLVDEAESTVICLNKFGKFLRSYLVEYGQNISNNGFEGITYNSTDQYFYLITEKNPSLLIKWVPGEGIVFTKELDFADDFSAITYNEEENLLWITSDESAKIFQCTLEGDTIKSYVLPMETIEGLVPTKNKDEFVGISDGDSKLYTFALIE